MPNQHTETTMARQLLAYVRRAGGCTMHEAARAIGAPYASVKSAMARLRRRGLVVMRGGEVARFPLTWHPVWEEAPDTADAPLEDDGWTPPTHYVPALRAQILGLRRPTGHPTRQVA